MEIVRRWMSYLCECVLMDRTAKELLGSGFE